MIVAVPAADLARKFFVTDTGLKVAGFFNVFELSVLLYDSNVCSTPSVLIRSMSELGFSSSTNFRGSEYSESFCAPPASLTIVSLLWAPVFVDS